MLRECVQLLMQTVNDIISLSGKEKDIHERNILSVDGKESRGSKRRSGIQGEVIIYKEYSGPSGHKEGG